MKLSKEKIAILTALSASQYDMSSREIFDVIAKVITDNGKISTALESVYGYLDGLEKSGHIENGLSDIVDKKTVLMWKITDKGRALVDNNKDVKAEVIDEPAALLHSIENLDKKINTLHKLMGIATPEMTKNLLDIIDDLSRIA